MVWQDYTGSCIIRQAMDEYRFNMSSRMYAFVWHEFCDWCLELSGTLYNSTNQPAQQAEAYLADCFPWIVGAIRYPFLSEELWERTKYDGL